jgi:hypothetical protein
MILQAVMSRIVVSRTVVKIPCRELSCRELSESLMYVFLADHELCMLFISEWRSMSQHVSCMLSLMQKQKMPWIIAEKFVLRSFSSFQIWKTRFGYRNIGATVRQLHFTFFKLQFIIKNQENFNLGWEGIRKLEIQWGLTTEMASSNISSRSFWEEFGWIVPNS